MIVYRWLIIISGYDCDRDGGVVVVKIVCDNIKLLVFGLYWNCDDHSRAYIHNIIIMLGYFESILDKHPDYTVSQKTPPFLF